MAFPRVRGPYGKNVTSKPFPVLSLSVHVLCPHHRVSRPLLMRRVSQSHLEGWGVGVLSEKEMDFQAEKKRERDFHMKTTSTQAKGWLAVPTSMSLAVPPASTQPLCDSFPHVHWNVCGPLHCMKDSPFKLLSFPTQLHSPGEYFSIQVASTFRSFTLHLSRLPSGQDSCCHCHGPHGPLNVLAMLPMPLLAISQNIPLKSSC